MSEQLRLVCKSISKRIGGGYFEKNPIKERLFLVPIDNRSAKDMVDDVVTKIGGELL